MANLMRASRGASPVGPRWAENFVQRQETLKMRFQRKIDYQRALTKDPRIVRNVVRKYGIPDSDIYNFDKTGFLIGMLSHAKVITTSNRKNRSRQPSE
jgi:hypothetical protein